MADDKACRSCVCENPLSVHLNEQHEYWSDDGVRYDSLGRMVRDLGMQPDFGNASKWTLSTASERGKAVEQACYALAQFGFVDIPGQGEEGYIKGVYDRVNAFSRWWDKSGATYVSHSTVVADPTILIAHQLDLVVEIAGKQTLLELKATSAKHPNWAIQCGCQGALQEIETGVKHDMAVLHLTPPGQAKRGYIYRPYGEEARTAWEYAREARLESLGAFARAKQNIKELL